MTESFLKVHGTCFLITVPRQLKGAGEVAEDGEIMVLPTNEFEIFTGGARAIRPPRATFLDERDRSPVGEMNCSSRVSLGRQLLRLTQPGAPMPGRGSKRNDLPRCRGGGRRRELTFDP